MQRLALFVAAIVFAIVCGFHVYRIMNDVAIVYTMNDVETTVPMMFSYVGGAVTGILAIWMLLAAMSSR